MAIDCVQKYVVTRNVAHISPASGTVRGRSGYLSTCIIFTCQQDMVSTPSEIRSSKYHAAAVMTMMKHQPCWDHTATTCTECNNDDEATIKLGPHHPMCSADTKMTRETLMRGLGSMTGSLQCRLLTTAHSGVILGPASTPMANATCPLRYSSGLMVPIVHWDDKQICTTWIGRQHNSGCLHTPQSTASTDHPYCQGAFQLHLVPLRVELSSPACSATLL